MPGATFSETWYQIADARVALLPTVKVQQHRYRGRPWFVLEDAYSQRFFRVTPQAYRFLCALRTDRTVDEVWSEFVAEHPAEAPGQEEVVRLLSQLHLSSLLHFQGQPHNDAIFERREKQRERELYGKLLSFLYVRVPLLNPEGWLNRIAPLIRLLTGPLALAVWLLVTATGALTVFDQAEALRQSSEGLLSLGNLPWLYLSMTLLKVLHELAHAFVCKRYGGHVHTFGVMFLIFTPLPYVDATTSWRFRSKWQRAYVGFAGMATELFCAALAAMVWAHTGDGLVHSLAFNVMVIGSVSSLLFNGNPLLRFDAYYVLADLIELPNLYQKSQQQCLYFCDRYLLGNRAAVAPATDRFEWVWFTAYGWLSFFYRLLLTTSVLLMVTSQWFAVGLVLLLTTVITLLLMPVRKLLGYLSGPALRTQRLRAWGGLSCLLLLLYLGFVCLPLPYAIRVPGVLEAQQRSVLYVETSGQLQRLQVKHGQSVRQGDILAVLRNPDLEQSIEVTRLQLQEHDTLLRLALHNAPADLLPLQRRIAMLEKRMAELLAMKERLVVRAPQSGEWVAPILHERLDNWLERGQVMGEVVDRTGFRFLAVVSQDEAAELFHAELPRGTVRLMGQAGEPVDVSHFRLLPYQRERLASSALGWMGGGEVPVRPDDASGTLASESFYEIQTLVAPAALASVSAYHGLTGEMRVPLADQTLYWRVRKAMMQLVQRRYGT